MHIPIPDFPEYERPELKVAETPAAYDLDKSEYQYHLAEEGRSTSFIIKKSNGEKFVPAFPAPILGQGGFGRVRLFISEQDSSQMFAVKNALRQSKSESQADINGKVRASIREIDYLAKVHPGLSPYLLMNFINKNRFDNRMLMPYFRGTTLQDFVITYLSRTEEFALLMLKVAQEVARVHQLGLFHGDIRSGNFIIERTKTLEFGIPSFIVRMIDFYLGGEIGKDRFEGVTGQLSHDELFTCDLNERVDVADLCWWIQICKSDLYLTIPVADQEIEQKFPAFREFFKCASAGEDVEVPVSKLHDFISQLTENLRTLEKLNKLKDSDEMPSYSEYLNLFSHHKTSSSEDDEIAKEWNATASLL